MDLQLIECDSMAPTVSVIILNYNGLRILGEECLSRLLSSVLHSRYPRFEVLFFDNGSTDGSVEYIKKRFCRSSVLRIIQNPRNSGYSVGNNLALRHASGKYVVLLNNDVEVDENWLAELVKVMEADPTVGITQSKILAYDRHHVQSAGNLLDAALMTHCIGRGQEDNGQYDTESEITYAGGAALIVRRSLIQKIGLFDSDFFFYHDDCDLGWRARLAGHRILLVPSSVVYHKGQITSSVTLPKTQDFFLNCCARFGMLIKNLELRNLPKFAFALSCSIAMDCLGLAFQGDIKTAGKFIVWVAKNFRHNWEKRLLVQTEIRKVPDHDILKFFLDSSIPMLRIYRLFSKIVHGQISKNFKILVQQAAENYYRTHQQPNRPSKLHDQAVLMSVQE